MKESIKALKIELKELSQKITELKKKRKSESNGYVRGLNEAQYEFRYKHIARCLLRGTPMEKIESKYREPDHSDHRYAKQKADEIVTKVKNGEVYGRKEDIRPGGQAPVEKPASSSVGTCLTKLRELLQG